MRFPLRFPCTVSVFNSSIFFYLFFSLRLSPISSLARSVLVLRSPSVYQWKIGEMWLLYCLVPKKHATVTGNGSGFIGPTAKAASDGSLSRSQSQQNKGGGFRLYPTAELSSPRTGSISLGAHALGAAKDDRQDGLSAPLRRGPSSWAAAVAAAPCSVLQVDQFFRQVPGRAVIVMSLQLEQPEQAGEQAAGGARKVLEYRHRFRATHIVSSNNISPIIDLYSIL